MQKREIYILTSDYYQYMLKSILKTTHLTRIKFVQERFSNEELYIKLQQPVARHKCIALGTLNPPDDNLLSFLLLCHTLKKEKATRLTALIPYLAYSRHDKDEPGKSHTIAFIGSILSAAGIDKVVTIDIHNPDSQSVFPMPLVSLPTTNLFAQLIKTNSMRDAMIVSPDEGAIQRCKDVAKAAGIKRSIAHFKKTRNKKGVTLGKFTGTISESAVVIDDMIDTGGTLISCCKRLLADGVKDITIMVTHGLFTGSKWKQLWKLGVRKIYCTDSIPLPEHARDKRIVVLSVVPLLKNYINA